MSGNGFKFGQSVIGVVDRPSKPETIINFKGKFVVEHFDSNGKLIETIECKNGVTNVGKDDVLNVMFRATTQSTTWYVGIIDNSGFTAVAGTDTMASHTGWNEFTTYSEAVRQTWTPAAPSSQSISNTTPMTFNITGSATLKGIFTVNNSTKGGTTGTLWATALFASNVTVNGGDQLKVTYTVSAS